MLVFVDRGLGGPEHAGELPLPEPGREPDLADPPSHRHTMTPSGATSSTHVYAAMIVFPLGRRKAAEQ